MKKCSQCSYSCKDNYQLNKHTTSWHSTINCKICENEMVKFDALLSLNNISADEVTSSHLMNARIKYCSKECRLIASNNSTRKWRKANPNKNLECSRKENERRKTCPNRMRWRQEYSQRPEIKERKNQYNKYRYQNNINGARDKHKAYHSKDEVRERRNRLQREKNVNKIKPIYQKVCDECKKQYETNISLSTRRWCSPKCRFDNWRKQPKNSINIRFQNAIRKALHGVIQTSEYFIYIDYTIDELKKHLEGQFEDWMNWNNHGLWHIDHIKPVASFEFISMEDEDFKKCWALGNLRPLRDTENMRKNRYYIKTHDLLINCNEKEM